MRAFSVETLPVGRWQARLGDRALLDALLFTWQACARGAAPPMTLRNVLQAADAGAALTQVFTELAHRFHSALLDVRVTCDVDALREVIAELVEIDGAALPLDALGALHARSREAAERRRHGLVYTPAALVRMMVEASVHDGDRVLDPACGSGAFLLEALARSADPLAAIHRLHGVDVDARAVEWARLSLLMLLASRLAEGAELPTLERNIIRANAITDALPLDRFDVVIGNPPYVDSETMARVDPALRRHCVAHYRSARGNWDLYCVFIERALRLCRSGGKVSMVVPNKVLSAEYAKATRSIVSDGHALLGVQDYAHHGVFGEAVYPVVIRARAQGPRPKTVIHEEMERSGEGFRVRRTRRVPHPRGEAPWSFSSESRRRWPELGSLADVRGAATVAEAYAMKPLIHEDGEGFRLINSGTLARGKLLWGDKACRYLGRSFVRPTVETGALERQFPRRAMQARHAKIIVSGLARQLTAAVDLEGVHLAGKSTSVITSAVDLRYLLALLHSQCVDGYLQRTYGGNQLRGGYMRLGPPQLRTIPVVPPDASDVARALLAAVQTGCGDVEKLAEAVWESAPPG